MAYTPEQGDIITLKFDPQAGHEQSRNRRKRNLPTDRLDPGAYDLSFNLPYSLRAVVKGFTVTQDAVIPVDFSEIILGRRRPR